MYLLIIHIGTVDDVNGLKPEYHGRAGEDYVISNGTTGINEGQLSAAFKGKGSNDRAHERGLGTVQ